MNDNYVITISRQFGSMGRLIAKKVAHELNIKYYDRDLIEKAAEMIGETPADLSRFDEAVKIPFAKALHPLGIGSSAAHRRLFEAQKSLILDYASSQSCVIVGRCSDYILRNHPRHLSVFIYAPFQKRIINSINQLDIPEEQVRDFVNEIDRARDSYHRFFAGCYFDTPENRHLMIDSSSMPIDDVVDLIINAAQKKLNISPM